MSKIIHYAIQKEYDLRQQRAESLMQERKSEAMDKLPRLKEIEEEIKSLGLKSNKTILLGRGNVENILLELTEKISSLKKEREKLLEQNGYPTNFLEVTYQCSHCNDTGLVQTGSLLEKCVCYRQMLIQHSYKNSNLKLVETENFSTFDEGFYPEIIDTNKYGIEISPLENIRSIKQHCLNFIENFDDVEEKNLLFLGSTGYGKTFMSNCIAKELLDKGKTVLYLTSTWLFDVLNEYKLRSTKDDGYHDSNYRNIFNVDLLIIDDLGIEPVSTAKAADLLSILNSRNINNRTRSCKIIISTNLDLKGIREYYSERVISRIIGDFEIFKFYGEDIRKLKKLNQ